MNHFEPGTLWLDTDNQPINAHGGGVLLQDGTYYWYGEHKIEGKSEAEKADGGIHCYSSKDLVHWDNCGVVMSVDYQSTNSEISYGVVLERPKVVYHTSSKTYLAYFKLYDKEHAYKTGYLGVAKSSSPTGPYVYSHRTLAANSNEGSGDFYMHVDSDSSLYHLGVRKPDKSFCITKMTEDYLLATNQSTPLDGITLHTEAPAGFRKNDTFYLLGSGSNGWAPNGARLFASNSFKGPYQDLGNPCHGKNPINGLGPEKTFGGQSSCVIKVQGFDHAYIAMFDIWRPDNPITGGYIWLPIIFEDNIPVIRWYDRWDLSIFS